MLDSGAGFFIQHKSSLKKNLDSKTLVKDPVLFSDPNPELYILTADYLSQAQLMPFLTKLRIIRKFRVCVLYVLPIIIEEKDKVGSQEEFFRDTVIDLKKYIKPASRVITLGRALYGALRTSDLLVEGFYDTVFNTPRAYAPSIACDVYPADSFYALWNLEKHAPYDSFEWHFFDGQVSRCLKAPKISTRVEEPELILVEDTHAFFVEHANEKKVAWDTETSRGMNYMTSNIICVTMSFDGHTGYFMRWNDIDPAELNVFFHGKFQIGANLKYDLRFMHHRKVFNARVDFDTRNAGHCLNEMRSNGLKAHAYLFTKFGGYEADLDRYKKRFPAAAHDYGLIPETILRPYATMDSIVCFQVYEAMAAQLHEDPELERYYYEDVIPAINAYLKVELRGECINWDRVREVRKILDDTLLDIEKKIHDIFGPNIPLGSPNALGTYIQNVLGWPKIEVGKSGVFSTGKEIMQEYAKMGFKGADLLAEHAEVKAIGNTFVGREEDNTGLWKYRYPDGRVHPTFDVMIAKSGRNQSRDPNGQNLTKRGKYAKLVRSMYTVPDPSFLLAESDGKGIQLRCGAAQSQDEELVRTFRDEDGDLHSKTGWNIFAKNIVVCPIDIKAGKDITVSSIDPLTITRGGVEKKLIAWEIKVGDLLDDGSTVSSIDRHIDEGHPITLEEFKAGKKDKFKKRRALGKTANLAFEFGQTAIAFANGDLKREWSIEDCNEFLEASNAIDAPMNVMESIGQHMGLDLDQCKYLACAEIIIDAHFETYPGLKMWQEKNITFADKYGYIRSPFGCRRLFPYLTYQGKDSNHRKIKSLHNTTANTPVQNHEVVVVNRALVKTEKYIDEHHLKSGIMGNIHDALPAYIKRSEATEIINVIQGAFKIDYPENGGVPFGSETDIADIQKGDVWGFGSIEGDSDDEFEYDYVDEEAL
jgi:DNA polymerase I-like protein with 3'-5' exonuclease and polymerase domains